MNFFNLIKLSIISILEKIGLPVVICIYIFCKCLKYFSQIIVKVINIPLILTGFLVKRIISSLIGLNLARKENINSFCLRHLENFKINLIRFFFFFFFQEYIIIFIILICFYYIPTNNQIWNEIWLWDCWNFNDYFYEIDYIKNPGFNIPKEWVAAQNKSKYEEESSFIFKINYLGFYEWTSYNSLFSKTNVNTFYNTFFGLTDDLVSNFLKVDKKVTFPYTSPFSMELFNTALFEYDSLHNFKMPSGPSLSRVDRTILYDEIFLSFDSEWFRNMDSLDYWILRRAYAKGWLPYDLIIDELSKNQSIRFLRMVQAKFLYWWFENFFSEYLFIYLKYKFLFWLTLNDLNEPYYFEIFKFTNLKLGLKIYSLKLKCFMLVFILDDFFLLNIIIYIKIVVSCLVNLIFDDLSGIILRYNIIYVNWFESTVDSYMPLTYSKDRLFKSRFLSTIRVLKEHRVLNKNNLTTDALSEYISLKINNFFEIIVPETRDQAILKRPWNFILKERIQPIPRRHAILGLYFIPLPKIEFLNNFFTYEFQFYKLRDRSIYVAFGDESSFLIEHFLANYNYFSKPSVQKLFLFNNYGYNWTVGNKNWQLDFFDQMYDQIKGKNLKYNRRLSYFNRLYVNLQNFDSVIYKENNNNFFKNTPGLSQVRKMQNWFSEDFKFQVRPTNLEGYAKLPYKIGAQNYFFPHKNHITIYSTTSQFVRFCFKFIYNIYALVSFILNFVFKNPFYFMFIYLLFFVFLILIKVIQLEFEKFKFKFRLFFYGYFINKNLILYKKLKSYRNDILVQNLNNSSVSEQDNFVELYKFLLLRKPFFLIELYKFFLTFFFTKSVVLYVFRLIFLFFFCLFKTFFFILKTKIKLFRMHYINSFFENLFFLNYNFFFKIVFIKFLKFFYNEIMLFFYENMVKLRYFFVTLLNLRILFVIIYFIINKIFYFFCLIVYNILKFLFFFNVLILWLLSWKYYFTIFKDRTIYTYLYNLNFKDINFYTNNQHNLNSSFISNQHFANKEYILTFEDTSFVSILLISLIMFLLWFFSLFSKTFVDSLLRPPVDLNPSFQDDFYVREEEDLEENFGELFSFLPEVTERPLSVEFIAESDIETLAPDYVMDLLKEDLDLSYHNVLSILDVRVHQNDRQINSNIASKFFLKFYYKSHMKKKKYNQLLYSFSSLENIIYKNEFSLCSENLLYDKTFLESFQKRDANLKLILNSLLYSKNILNSKERSFFKTLYILFLNLSKSKIKHEIVLYKFLIKFYLFKLILLNQKTKKYEILENNLYNFISKNFLKNNNKIFLKFFYLLFKIYSNLLHYSIVTEIKLNKKKNLFLKIIFRKKISYEYIKKFKLQNIDYFENYTDSSKVVDEEVDKNFKNNVLLFFDTGNYIALTDMFRQRMIRQNNKYYDRPYNIYRFYPTVRMELFLLMSINVSILNYNSLYSISEKLIDSSKFKVNLINVTKLTKYFQVKQFLLNQIFQSCFLVIINDLHIQKQFFKFIIFFYRKNYKILNLTKLKSKIFKFKLIGKDFSKYENNVFLKEKKKSIFKTLSLFDKRQIPFHPFDRWMTLIHRWKFPSRKNFSIINYRSNPFSNFKNKKPFNKFEYGYFKKVDKNLKFFFIRNKKIKGFFYNFFDYKLFSNVSKKKLKAKNFLIFKDLRFQQKQNFQKIYLFNLQNIRRNWKFYKISTKRISWIDRIDVILDRYPKREVWGLQQSFDIGPLFEVDTDLEEFSIEHYFNKIIFLHYILLTDEDDFSVETFTEPSEEDQFYLFNFAEISPLFLINENPMFWFGNDKIIPCDFVQYNNSVVGTDSYYLEQGGWLIDVCIDRCFFDVTEDHTIMPDDRLLLANLSEYTKKPFLDEDILQTNSSDFREFFLHFVEKTPYTVLQDLEKFWLLRYTYPLMTENQFKDNIFPGFKNNLYFQSNRVLNKNFNYSYLNPDPKIDSLLFLIFYNPYNPVFLNYIKNYLDFNCISILTNQMFDNKFKREFFKKYDYYINVLNLKNYPELTIEEAERLWAFLGCTKLEWDSVDDFKIKMIKPYSPWEFPIALWFILKYSFIRSSDLNWAHRRNSFTGDLSEGVIYDVETAVTQKEMTTHFKVSNGGVYYSSPTVSDVVDYNIFDVSTFFYIFKPKVEYFIQDILEDGYNFFLYRFDFMVSNLEYYHFFTNVNFLKYFLNSHANNSTLEVFGYLGFIKKDYFLIYQTIIDSILEIQIYYQNLDITVVWDISFIFKIFFYLLFSFLFTDCLNEMLISVINYFIYPEQFIFFYLLKFFFFSLFYFLYKIFFFFDFFNFFFIFSLLKIIFIKLFLFLYLKQYLYILILFIMFILFLC
jgi:hypothetical protein